MCVCVCVCSDRGRSLSLSMLIPMGAVTDSFILVSLSLSLSLSDCPKHQEKQHTPKVLKQATTDIYWADGDTKILEILPQRHQQGSEYPDTGEPHTSSPQLKHISLMRTRRRNRNCRLHKSLHCRVQFWSVNGATQADLTTLTVINTLRAQGFCFCEHKMVLWWQ